MMKDIDVCYIKLFLRINLEKFNRFLLRNGNFEFAEVGECKADTVPRGERKGDYKRIERY